MKCPHCQVTIHDDVRSNPFGRDRDGHWFLDIQTCPSCSRFVMHLVSKQLDTIKGVQYQISRYLVRPKVASRPAPPTDVPAEFAKDYIEASLILEDSPQASAALSRRCLQHILHEKAGVEVSTLAKEIEDVIESGQLPSHLSKAIDAIRHIGNFAAHPTKSTNSGAIVSVESGEAEWTLDVLDGLFDFYFVHPNEIARRRDALNMKLASVGKPPMKG